MICYTKLSFDSFYIIFKKVPLGPYWVMAFLARFWQDFSVLIKKSGFYQLKVHFWGIFDLYLETFFNAQYWITSENKLHRKIWSSSKKIIRILEALFLKRKFEKNWSLKFERTGIDPFGDLKVCEEMLILTFFSGPL